MTQNGKKDDYDDNDKDENMEDDNDAYRQLPSPNYSCWRPLRCNGQCSKLTSLQGRTCGKDTDKNDRKHFNHNHDYFDVMKNIVLV